MSLYSIYKYLANKPLIIYEEFYQIYKKAYLSNVYDISDLSNKLKKLEEVEQEWVHHRDYGSYKASVGALRKIIDDILNGNLIKGGE